PAMATPAPQPVFQPAPPQPVAMATPKPATPPATASVAATGPARIGGAKVPNTSALVNLIEKGMDKFAEGDLSGAETFFQQTLAQDPNFVEGLVGVAKVQIRQEKLNEAVELLQKAVALDPNDPAAL